jgi:hypothetical protein
MKQCENIQLTSIYLCNTSHLWNVSNKWFLAFVTKWSLLYCLIIPRHLTIRNNKLNQSSNLKVSITYNLQNPIWKWSNDELYVRHSTQPLGKTLKHTIRTNHLITFNNKIFELQRTWAWKQGFLFNELQPKHHEYFEVVCCIQHTNPPFDDCNISFECQSILVHTYHEIFEKNSIFFSLHKNINTTHKWTCFHIWTPTYCQQISCLCNTKGVVPAQNEV